MHDYAYTVVKQTDRQTRGTERLSGGPGRGRRTVALELVEGMTTELL